MGRPALSYPRHGHQASRIPSLLSFKKKYMSQSRYMENFTNSAVDLLFNQKKRVALMFFSLPGNDFIPVWFGLLYS